MTQLDSKTLSALRAVLDDVCGHLPLSSISARTFWRVAFWSAPKQVTKPLMS
jgi:hypothetical protein